ncbi:MAG: IclR family transcriptional regulator [Devosia sp.]|nr:MAG: IclR family transcriptional regulator [Devosia sp.]
MKQTSIRKVKSADRTLDLLETLARSANGMTASEISNALSIPKSSLFHLLGTLDERGYVSVDAEGRHRIGPAVSRLVAAGGPEVTLLSAVERALDGLRDAINESCSFNVEKGDEVEVVATRAGRNALTYTMQVGDLAPLYAVSAGKVLLAQKDRDWLDAYLARIRFESFTPNTIQSHERLMREIERSRAEGFGFVDEEYTPGIVGLGAAVRVAGRAIGAINVAMPSPRYNPQKASLIRQHLRKAVSLVESQVNEAGPAA